MHLGLWAGRERARGLDKAGVESNASVTIKPSRPQPVHTTSRPAKTSTSAKEPSVSLTTFSRFFVSLPRTISQRLLNTTTKAMHLSAVVWLSVCALKGSARPLAFSNSLVSVSSRLPQRLPGHLFTSRSVAASFYLTSPRPPPSSLAVPSKPSAPHLFAAVRSEAGLSAPLSHSWQSLHSACRPRPYPYPSQSQFHPHPLPV